MIKLKSTRKSAILLSLALISGIALMQGARASPVTYKEVPASTPQYQCQSGNYSISEGLKTLQISARSNISVYLVVYYLNNGSLLDNITLTNEDQYISMKFMTPDGYNITVTNLNPTNATVTINVQVVMTKVPGFNVTLIACILLVAIPLLTRRITSKINRERR